MERNLGMQFIWWTGVVESRHDPLKAGRCKVRIVGSHTDNKSDLPTSDLPWAQPVLPLNDSASIQLKEGDYVVGFYFDGPDSQVPMIMGLLPGVPTESRPASVGFSDPRTAGELSGAPKRPADLAIASGAVTITEGPGARNPQRLNESTLSRVARNEKISHTPIQFKKDSVTTSIPAAGGSTWSEPPTPYAAQYPYNRVMETESGHILEFDDTPGAERVHIYHRSGTFEEVHPDGTKVTRIHADAYEVVLSDKHVYINGNYDITAQGDVNIKAGKNVNIEAGQDVVISALGMFNSQGLSQSHTATSAMSLTGLPLNLNGPPTTILEPPLPVVVVTIATFTE